MKTNTLFLFVIGITMLLLSCKHPPAKNQNPCKEKYLSIEERKEKIAFDSEQFKKAVDTLLLNIENNTQPFAMTIDTFSENSKSLTKWQFGKYGLFSLINPQETEQLVMYHLQIPNTDKVLRIYIIEAFYADSASLFLTYHSILKEKNKQIFEPFEDGGSTLVNQGLTWLNDFVIILSDKIYWLNVSSQYSKKNFNHIIELFKENINDKNYIDTIKCSFNCGCE